MLETDLSNRPDRHPVINLVLIFIVVGIGFVFVGPFIGVFIASPFYPGTMEELFEAVQDPVGHPQVKIPLYIIQGCATLFGLVVAPAMLMRRTNLPVAGFFQRRKVDWIPVLITTFAVVMFMGVNSIFIEWNSNIHFPDFAKPFEDWARSYEDAAAEVTRFLTNFETRGELVLAMIVIAVLPAIGEEIVFRGLIQNELFRATNNIHVSIWFAAVLFSAIHFQFFGFVPRLLLGALFGYLYYWSGNLSMAILAHFVNNGFSVMALYFYQQGAFEYDPEGTEAVPANVVVISTLATAALLYYFYKYFEQRKPSFP